MNQIEDTASTQDSPELTGIEARHTDKRTDPPSPNKLFSEWSHQAVLPQEQSPTTLEDGEWQEMPAIAQHDIYDDESGAIIAHAQQLTAEVLEGRAKGYSRVQGDDDAKSVDSVDLQTNHLFNAAGENSGLDDEATVLSQLSHTKNLLTDAQRIAYTGICKLVLVIMLKEITIFNSSKQSKGEGRFALEGMILWSQKITLRLYQHLEITPAEQLMVEQLSEHHIQAADLAPTLTTAARVSNPINTSSISKVAMPNQTSAAAPNSTIDSADIKAAENLELDIRWTVLFDLFLLLLADGHYDARSRVFLIAVASTLGISYMELTKFEKKVTDALEVQDQEAAHVENEQALTSDREKSSRHTRYMIMGLATLGGGLVIGLSAGLLAPVIGAGLGAGFASIGVSGATSFLAGTTGAALITTSGVVTGSTIATRAARKRVSSVQTFEFKPLYDNKRVNLLITVPGWLAGSEDDVRLPFSTVDPVMGDICSVLWEPELLRTFQATGNILATEVLTQSLQQVLGQTVLTALMSALQWPLVLTKLSYLIDNPWSNSLDRAKAAGLILADALASRSLGVRPVSLVGYSLGARVIYYALLELAEVKAFGIIENVYLFGAPIVVTSKEWRKAKSVVAGRFVNGYVQNDWILGYLFRATSGGIGRVAGLRPVEGIESVENVDCTGDVDGHMGYRQAIPRLMQKIGYLVTSEEFQEIEDPDPDKTRERARELLDDIEEARKTKAKRRFFRFGKKNLVTPDALPTAADSKEAETGHVDEPEFDIERIRNEMSKPETSQPTVPPRGEEITMTFDMPEPPPAMARVASQDVEPSGYIPRPSIQHSNSLGMSISRLQSPIVALKSPSIRSHRSGSAEIKRLSRHFDDVEISTDSEITMTFD